MHVISHKTRIHTLDRAHYWKTDGDKEFVIYNANYHKDLINGQECLEPKPSRFRVCKVISNVK